MVNGTVTISLSDFQTLLESSTNADDVLKSTTTASKEIQVFLSYLHAQLDLTPHIEAFNRQSKKSKIIVEDGNRIKIQFNEK